ncbi:hypothetical protein [Amycolatopsis sp.]|jgi:hypothetical protein|nr:hypothetical protein [Amycolatopsis sp.]
MSTPAETTNPVTEEAPVLPPLPEVPKEDHDHDHDVTTNCAGGCPQKIEP